MKRLLFSAIGVIAILLAGSNAAVAQEFQIRSTTPYTATILGAPLWTGNIPTSILISDSYAKVEFPITALAPYSVLADGALGVDVDFELWSVQGSKIASDTIYSFNWNPVSSQNMVSFYIDKDDVVPMAVMRIKTEQTFRTNGLISRYMEDVTQINVALAYGTPPGAPSLTSGSKGYLISNQNSQGITGYEVHLRYILDNGLSPSMRANYSEPVRIKSLSERTFGLSDSEIATFLQSQNALSAKYVLLSVVAVSDAGSSQHSNGFYLDSSRAGAAITVAAVEISGPKTMAPESVGVYKVWVVNSSKFGIAGKSPIITHSGVGKLTQMQSTTAEDGSITLEISTLGAGEGAFTITASLDGKSKSFDVRVQTAPVVKNSEVILESFVGKSTKLNQAQRTKIKSWVKANSKAIRFVCIGYRLESQSQSLDALSFSRAKATCDYAKSLNKNLETTYEAKTTSTRNYSGKVVITIQNPIN